MAKVAQDTKYSIQEILNNVFDDTNLTLAGSSEGSVPSGSTDSGNPVKVGGVYNTTPPTLTNGQRGDAQLDSRGNQKVYMDNVLSYGNDSVTTYPAGCTVTSVDLATDADVTVTSSPAKLLGIYVLVALSAHPAPIKDNATAKFTLPASLAAGTNIPCYGANFTTSIVVESDNSATGTILVFWLPA